MAFYLLLSYPQSGRRDLRLLSLINHTSYLGLSVNENTEQCQTLFSFRHGRCHINRAFLQVVKAHQWPQLQPHPASSDHSQAIRRSISCDPRLRSAVTRPWSKKQKSCRRDNVSNTLNVLGRHHRFWMYGCMQTWLQYHDNSNGTRLWFFGYASR